MSYTIDEIKADLSVLTTEQFYTKYIVCSENWYLENILKFPTSDRAYVLEEYRLIISNYLNISINSILMVGSGKIGYSLSPLEEKKFKPFNMDEKIRNISDLDIAIISPELFNTFWRSIRCSYKQIYKDLYEKHIFREIYRGYINERNIEDEVDVKMKIKLLYEKMKSLLKDREKTILELRFGLGGKKPKTQNEIAKMMGISRSYVSRIETKAIGKLAKEIKE